MKKKKLGAECLGEEPRQTDRRRGGFVYQHGTSGRILSGSGQKREPTRFRVSCVFSYKTGCCSKVSLAQISSNREFFSRLMILLSLKPGACVLSAPIELHVNIRQYMFNQVTHL